MHWINILSIVLGVAAIVLNILTWRMNRETRRRLAEDNESFDNRPDIG